MACKTGRRNLGVDSKATRQKNGKINGGPTAQMERSPAAKVSQHCYAERDLQHLPRFKGRCCVSSGTADQPIGGQKPRRIFVNSMSDLFHEEVPTGFIDEVFAVMARDSAHQVAYEEAGENARLHADPAMNNRFGRPGRVFSMLIPLRLRRMDVRTAIPSAAKRLAWRVCRTKPPPTIASRCCCGPMAAVRWISARAHC